LNLNSILAPIQDEMPLVTQALEEVANVDFPQLAEVARHAMGSLGKGIRPALTLLSGKFNYYNLDHLIPMAAAVELLHTATLVHDDTIDKSPLRRGIPTLNSIWGDSAATIAGDYLFAKSAELAAMPGNLRVVRLFAKTLMAVAKGELEETLSVYNWQQGREDYFKRINGKTAALFEMATESGAILSNSPEETIQALKAYGQNLGLAFQVVDDLLDFTGEEEVIGKPVGNDLLQGILTFPAILLIEQYSDNNPIQIGFENRGQGEHLRQAVAEIRDSSLIKECYSIAVDFSVKARQAIEILPDGDPKKALISLIDYLIDRKK